MTPRLAVTREQAEALFVDSPGRMLDVTLRLPERPTMQCQLCDDGDLYESTLTGVTNRRCPNCSSGAVPIPEGTRVEVGWWAGLYLGHEDWRNEWRPVAYATLAEVIHRVQRPDDPEPWAVTVVVSDIEPAGEDQS